MYTIACNDSWIIKNVFTGYISSQLQPAVLLVQLYPRKSQIVRMFIPMQMQMSETLPQLQMWVDVYRWWTFLNNYCVHILKCYGWLKLYAIFPKCYAIVFHICIDTYNQFNSWCITRSYFWSIFRLWYYCKLAASDCNQHWNKLAMCTGNKQNKFCKNTVSFYCNLIK